MKIAILNLLIILFLTSSCKTNSVSRNEPLKEPTPHFKGEKIFEIVSSNMQQMDNQCEMFCEKTCGGKCLNITEVISRCFKENPNIKYPSGLTAGERLNMCVEQSPSFVAKYPNWFNITYQSLEGAPTPTKVPCTVICH